MQLTIFLQRSWKNVKENFWINVSGWLNLSVSKE